MPAAADLGTTEYDLSTAEAAAYLGIHPDTLKRWVKKGDCPARKLPSGWYRFRISDLDALVGTAA